MQGMGDTMSAMVLEASDKAKGMPGQTTPVVRAFVSIALDELTSMDPASDGTADSIHQVECVGHDSAFFSGIQGRQLTHAIAVSFFVQKCVALPSNRIPVTHFSGH